MRYRVHADSYWVWQNEEVEYVDEMGRTRRGTRIEAREAEEAKAEIRGKEQEAQEDDPNVIGQAHAEVL